MTNKLSSFSGWIIPSSAKGTPFHFESGPSGLGPAPKMVFGRGIFFAGVAAAVGSTELTVVRELGFEGPGRERMEGVRMEEETRVAMVEMVEGVTKRKEKQEYLLAQ